MKFFKKSLIIKIPSYINLYYYSSILLVFRYKNKLTYLKFCYKLIFFATFNFNFYIVQIKNYQNAINFFFYVKKILYNLTKKVYKKLVLIGIGYKVLQIKMLNNISILIFKLGFSHCFYFKFFNNNFSVIKQSKIYLKNCSLKRSLLISNLIKQLKSLTIYNNKGIFFYNQI